MLLYFCNDYIGNRKRFRLTDFPRLMIRQWPYLCDRPARAETSKTLYTWRVTTAARFFGRTLARWFFFWIFVTRFRVVKRLFRNDKLTWKIFDVFFLREVLIQVCRDFVYGRPGTHAKQLKSIFRRYRIFHEKAQYSYKPKRISLLIKIRKLWLFWLLMIATNFVVKLSKFN